MHGEQNEPAVLDGPVIGLDAPPRTQDADVDAVLATLVGAADRPLAAQAALLDDVHQQLQHRLARSSGEGALVGDPR